MVCIGDSRIGFCHGLLWKHELNLRGKSVLLNMLRFWLKLIDGFCIIIYNSPFITIDTAIIRSSRLVVFCKKSVLMNFAKFTWKHLRFSLVLNEAADPQSLTLSKKEISAQIFFCEFCEISRNTFFKNHLDGCFSINTFRLFKNDATHFFRLSIFSA